MKPLLLSKFTATSCIGRGVTATLRSLIEQRSGLTGCDFETVNLDTYIGEVAGVDAQRLPPTLRKFDCRNNRLAELALQQDELPRGARAHRGALRPRARRGVSRHQHGRHSGN